MLYTVTLRHDGGTVAVTTYAGSAEGATEFVCRAELAPRSAVLLVVAS